MKKLSIIVPVYNEKKTILEILKRVENVNLEDLGFEKEIIIVDDGSTDGTREILKKLTSKYKIIFHPKNKGKGSAIKSGLKKVTGDYVIIQDADLEYDPKDYRALLECAIKNQAQVVYGSRTLNPKNRYSHFIYYLGGKFLSFLTSFLYGAKITDEATGYKLFKTELLKKISLESKGFDFCPEVTAKILKQRIKIFEVPISYYPRKKKEGKKIRVSDGLKAAFLLIKLRFAKETWQKILAIFLFFLILIANLSLITKHIHDPFLRWNEDNNALYGLVAQNWLKFGISKLKFGMVGYWLENLNEKISFYTHHPDLFIFPTYLIYKLFGISEFTTRLSPLLFAIFSIILFFFLTFEFYKDYLFSFFSTFIFAILPAITFYGKMLDHEIFVLFFFLLSLFFYAKIKNTKRKLYYFLFFLTIFFGGFMGWHFFFTPFLIWFLIFFDKNFPQRKIFLIFLPLMTLLSFSLIISHIYFIGGKEALIDLKNAFFARTSSLPLNFWLNRIYFLLKLNFTLPIVLLGFFYLFYFIYRAIFDSEKIKILPIALFLFPFLITFSFRQWVTHPYGPFYFVGFFSIAGGEFLYLLCQKLKERKEMIGISLCLILLLIQYFICSNSLKFFDQNFILDKDSFELLTQIKNKFNPESICLGREETGIGYHPIFSFYLKIPIKNSPECIDKVPFTIIFRPYKEGDFRFKEAELFLNAGYSIIDCKGIICFLKK
jgi:glycosyltransferase involved in cell wall biosynthesis